MTQVALAERLEISASYLNLIEHGRRPLTAPLLIKLAGVLDLDLRSFAPEGDAQVVEDLMEAFGDGVFDGHDLTASDVKDFAAQSPRIARAVLALYEGYRDSAASVRALADRVSSDQEVPGLASWRLPSEEVSDLIQRNTNYFPELEAAAEALWVEAELDLDDLYGGLVRHLKRRLGVRVEIARQGDETRALRRYDPDRRRLALSELLPTAGRNFQLAHQIGLLAHSEMLDRIAADAHLSADASRALCRVAMANYFAGAVLMPYDKVLEAAQVLRYDVENIESRFQASFEQVCHRLTTLRRPGREGIPFHFLKVDIAGNISKRFSASGIAFARFSGACPRWNLVAAFLTPGKIRSQLSIMPDGSTYFCIARTVLKGAGGFRAQHSVHAITLGCDVQQARKMIYADGVALNNPDAAVPIGVTCRLCERTDCEQRVFPAIVQPLDIRENVRGFSFYAPPPED